MSTEGISERLFREGVLLDLDVMFWRGGSRLHAEDLGLEKDEVAGEFHLGRRDLIPAETLKRFSQIERQARRALEERSHAFPVLKGRYVSWKVVPEILTTLRTLQDEFNGCVAAFLDGYPDLVEAMRPALMEAARLAYSNSQNGYERSSFIDKYVGRVMADYPTVDQLRSAFSLDWTLVSAARPNVAALADQEALAIALAQEKAETLFHEKYEEKIGAFLESAAQRVRGEVAELAARARRYLEGERCVSARNLGSFREKIAALRDVNFLGDVEVEGTLTRLGQVVESLAGETQEGQAAHAIESMLAGVEASMNDASAISRVTGDYERSVQI